MRPACCVKSGTYLLIAVRSLLSCSSSEKKKESFRMSDETTPLLGANGDFSSSDLHNQFCMLIGIAPDPDKGFHPHPSSATLYARAIHKRRSQSLTYSFTAALSNSLLLLQVVLGATLTALGASRSSHILITVFGVLNTIIAGLVAYLKSRGQPMRARVFRDDLEHVVEEIENSKTMWLGIKNDVHGYDEIDVEDKVSVRSEVARLTRLYESAVKKYKQNNPDLYNMGGGILDPITGLKARPPPGAQLPPVAPAADPSTAAAPPPAADDEDESPATAKPKAEEPKVDDNDKGKEAKGEDSAGETSKAKDDPPKADAAPKDKPAEADKPATKP